MTKQPVHSIHIVFDGGVHSLCECICPRRCCALFHTQTNTKCDATHSRHRIIDASLHEYGEYLSFHALFNGGEGQCVVGCICFDRCRATLTCLSSHHMFVCVSLIQTLSEGESNRTTPEILIQHGNKNAYASLIADDCCAATDKSECSITPWGPVVGGGVMANCT
jgi:hypothetical protein